jgi:type VI secretion system protein ImpC
MNPYRISYTTPAGERVLPFVVGVIGDFSGNGLDLLPRFSERQFIDVDHASFDRAIEGLAPRLDLCLPDVLGVDVACSLALRSFADFTPAGIVERLPLLADTLAALQHDPTAGLRGAFLRQLDATLHHDEFLRLEGAWRGLHDLVRHAETSKLLKLRVLSASKDELSRDLKRATSFDQSRLFKRLYEDQIGRADGEPFGLLIVDYEFARGPDDVALLRGLAQIAAAAHAPLVAAPHPHFFGGFNWKTAALRLAKKHKGLQNEVRWANEYREWHELRDRHEASFVALVLPRVLARLPHHCVLGPELVYDEVTAAPPGAAHTRRCCWMSGAYIVGERIAKAFAQLEWPSAFIGEGPCVLPELPHFRIDTRGSTERVGPTEFVIEEGVGASLRSVGLLPLVQNGADHACVLLDGAPTLVEPTELPSLMAPVATKLATNMASLPAMLAGSRILHYLAMQWPWQPTDKNARALRVEVGERLNGWLASYASVDPDAGRPLKEAFVNVVEAWDRLDCWRLVAALLPRSSVECSALPVVSGRRRPSILPRFSLLFPARDADPRLNRPTRPAPAYSFEVDGVLDDLQMRLNFIGQPWRWHASDSEGRDVCISASARPFDSVLRIDPSANRFLLRIDPVPADTRTYESLCTTLREKFFPAIGARFVLALDGPQEIFAYYTPRDDQRRPRAVYRIARPHSDKPMGAAYWGDGNWIESQDIVRRYWNGFDADVDEISEDEAAHAVAGLDAGGKAAFRCPECARESLSLGLSLELVPSSDWDETALQLLCCWHCRFHAVGIYEEERRGSGAHWHHTGYRVSPQAFATLQSEIAQCIDRQNRQCRCPIHRRLGGQDPRSDFPTASAFNIAGRRD